MYAASMSDKLLRGLHIHNDWIASNVSSRDPDVQNSSFSNDGDDFHAPWTTAEEKKSEENKESTATTSLEWNIVEECSVSRNRKAKNKKQKNKLHIFKETKKPNADVIQLKSRHSITKARTDSSNCVFPEKRVACADLCEKDSKPSETPTAKKPTTTVSKYVDSFDISISPTKESTISINKTDSNPSGTPIEDKPSTTVPNDVHSLISSTKESIASVYETNFIPSESPTSEKPLTTVPKNFSSSILPSKDFTALHETDSIPSESLNENEKPTATEPTNNNSIISSVLPSKEITASIPVASNIVTSKSKAKNKKQRYKPFIDTENKVLNADVYDLDSSHSIGYFADAKKRIGLANDNNIDTNPSETSIAEKPKTTVPIDIHSFDGSISPTKEIIASVYETDSSPSETPTAEKLATAVPNDVDSFDSSISPTEEIIASAHEAGSNASESPVPEMPTTNISINNNSISSVLPTKESTIPIPVPSNIVTRKAKNKKLKYKPFIDTEIKVPNANVHSSHSIIEASTDRSCFVDAKKRMGRANSYKTDTKPSGTATAEKPKTTVPIDILSFDSRISPTKEMKSSVYKTDSNPSKPPTAEKPITTLPKNVASVDSSISSTEEITASSSIVASKSTAKNNKLKHKPLIFMESSVCYNVDTENKVPDADVSSHSINKASMNRNYSVVTEKSITCAAEKPKTITIDVHSSDSSTSTKESTKSTPLPWNIIARKNKDGNKEANESHIFTENSVLNSDVHDFVSSNTINIKTRPKTEIKGYRVITENITCEDVYETDFKDSETPSYEKWITAKPFDIDSYDSSISPAIESAASTAVAWNITASQNKAETNKQTNESHIVTENSEPNADIYNYHMITEGAKGCSNFTEKNIARADICTDSNMSEIAGKTATTVPVYVENFDSGISLHKNLVEVENKKNVQTSKLTIGLTATIPNDKIEENIVISNMTGFKECKGYEKEKVMQQIPSKFESTKLPEIFNANLNFDNLNDNKEKVCKDRNYSLTAVYTEMDKFYNESWGGEQFNHKELQKTMSGDKSLWAIDPKDEIGLQAVNQNTVTCFYCNRSGHRDDACRLKPPVCYMCGTTGHVQNACPNKICVNCGSPNEAFSTVCLHCHYWNLVICGECNQQGHPSTHCPDLWRRYHNTTDITTHLVENSFKKPSSEMYCSGCAERGHLVNTCRKSLTFSDFTINSPYVHHYKPVYDILSTMHVSSENQNSSGTTASENDRKDHQFEPPTIYENSYDDALLETPTKSPKLKKNKSQLQIREGFWNEDLVEERRNVKRALPDFIPVFYRNLLLIFLIAVILFYVD